PAFPGGKFAWTLAAASCRLVKDSKGSRRVTLGSGSASAFGAAAAAFLLVGGVVFAAGLTPCLAGAGLVCACVRDTAALSTIPIRSVVSPRMARSFLLTVFSQAASILL